MRLGSWWVARMVGSHRHLGVTPRFRFFKQLTVGNNHLSLAAQAKLAMALGYKKTREPQPSGSHTEVAVSVHAPCSSRRVCGVAVFEEGDEPDGLYVILRGIVLVVKRLDEEVAMKARVSLDELYDVSQPALNRAELLGTVRVWRWRWW